MAPRTQKAIILRTQDLRETSLIVTAYTRDCGKVRGVVKGVRGPRAQWAVAAFEPFSIDEIVFYERRRSDLFMISQWDIAEHFLPIRSSLARLACALYLVELLDSVTTPGDPNPEIFDLAQAILHLLAGQASSRRALRIFEIKLLCELGLMPELASCVACGAPAASPLRFSFARGGVVCGNCTAHDRKAAPVLAGTIRFMEHIRMSSLDKASRVKVSAGVGEELESLLRGFIDYHIGHRLNTVEFMKNAFAGKDARG